MLLSVEPGSLFGDDFGSYFKESPLSRMDLSVNRPGFTGRDILEPFIIKKTIRYCSDAASILLNIACKAEFTILPPSDRSNILSFLEAVKCFFIRLESADISFSYDDDGFRRLAEYTSIICYVFYEVHFMSSFFKLYTSLSPRIRSKYLGFGLFRAHLILHDFKTGRKKTCYIVKINSLSRFMDLLYNFCQTL